MTIPQVLKKFFIDDPVERTKKIYFWLYIFVGLRFSFLYILFYHWCVLRALKVGKDGRVGTLQTASLIVYGCNLRCEFCSVFCTHRKGYCPADELLESYVQWRKKIKPKYFVLSGGEPLLHPELVRILRESAKIWNDSKLWLFTNGLLLEQAKPEVFQAIKEAGYKLTISEHTFEPEHRKKLDAGYARLKLEKIPFVVRPSHLVWQAQYQYSETGNIIPYNSDPKKAWNNCKARHCTSIAKDKLYKCGRWAEAYDGLQDGVLDATAWKSALAYQPLTLQSNPEEIVEHLRKREMPSCAICHENPVMVPARQLPLLRDNEIMKDNQPPYYRSKHYQQN